MIQEFYKELNNKRVKELEVEGYKSEWAPIKSDSIFNYHVGVLIVKDHHKVSETIPGTVRYRWQERYIGNIVFIRSMNRLVFIKDSNNEIIFHLKENIIYFVETVKKSSLINRIKYHLGFNIYFNPYTKRIDLLKLFNIIEKYNSLSKINY